MLPSIPFNILALNFIITISEIRIVKFSSVTHLTLHFPSNFGDETSKIYFIGLKGDWSPAHQHGVTLCTYETTPSMADHKDKVLESSNMNIQ